MDGEIRCTKLEPGLGGQWNQHPSDTIKPRTHSGVKHKEVTNSTLRLRIGHHGNSTNSSIDHNNPIANKDIKETVGNPTNSMGGNILEIIKTPNAKIPDIISNTAVTNIEIHRTTTEETEGLTSHLNMGGMHINRKEIDNKGNRDKDPDSTSVLTPKGAHPTPGRTLA